MSFSLTSAFFANARGITFLDGSGVTWSFNKNTNSVTASASGGGGSGTVTSVAAGSSSIVIGGTPTIAPTVDLSTAAKAALASITPATPATIPDLITWWSSENILASVGSIIYRLQEKTPWITGVVGSVTGGASSAIAVSATQLNSNNTLTWPAAASTGTITLAFPFNLPAGATFFVVINGSTAAGTQAIVGSSGASSGTALYLSVSAGAKITLIRSGVSVIGTATNAWTPGAWFQANATYNSTTGAFAFRQARTANGSGTGGTGAGAASTGFFGADTGATTNMINAASIAEIIVYGRSLSGTEITNVENYLFAKWGV